MKTYDISKIKKTLEEELKPERYAHTIGVAYTATSMAMVHDVDIEKALIAGLLHDIDFEKFPEEHCKKAPELLAEVNASERLVHAVCSHGWNLTVNVTPEHFMEKVLYATDELTGLIWACSIMLPSKSVKDLQLKTIRKKFRNEQFAAGCSRHVITVGAELLGWTLDELFERTLVAMQETEETVEALSNG